MANGKIWRKALEQGLDEKDAKLLHVLSQERKFSEADIQAIAKQSQLTVADAKKRLHSLKQKGIILKDQVSIIDQIKIWDGYYFVLIKAVIVPPIVGMETKFPTGWKFEDYLEGLKKVGKELGFNLIREAHMLQGTEWDMILIVSATSLDEFAEFMSKVAKQGWVAKTWSFTPVEYGGKWIFDPVASPDPVDYETEIAPNALWKKR